MSLSRALHLRQMRTALPNTFVRLSTLFQPHILCLKSLSYLSLSLFNPIRRSMMWMILYQLFRIKLSPVVEDVDLTLIHMSRSWIMDIGGGVICVT
jgi:hypothetical protein